MESVTAVVVNNLTDTPIYSTIPVAYLWIKSTIYIMEGLMCVVGSVLTILAIRKSKKLRQAPTNTFILNLAVADGIIGGLVPIVFIFRMSSSSELVARISVCLTKSPYYLSFGVSLKVLLVIAIDRFIAVVYPLSYKKWVTIRRARIICCVMWLYECMTMGFLSCYYGALASLENIVNGSLGDLLPQGSFSWLSATGMYIPIVGNIVMYGCIFVSLKRKKRVGVQQSSDKEANRQSRITASVFRMMATVLGYLIFSWLPISIIVNFYRLTDPNAPAWWLYSYDVAVVLMYSNSAVNPLIYSGQSREFRLAYARILKLRQAKGSNDDVTETRTNTNVSTIG